MSYELYKMNHSIAEKLPMKLLYVTHSAYDKGWHSTQHTHHFTELFYIVKGKGSFLLKDQEILVKENDLVIINPNIEHTEKSNWHDSLEYIALGIEGLSFSLMGEENTELGIYTYQGDREDILFYLHKLLEEVQQNQAKYELVCQNIIEILIIRLRRDRNFTIKKTQAQNVNKSSAFIQYYINQNYRDDLTLDKLAEIGHINKYYLGHIFKQDIGVSPIEYLNQVRIREARKLLETTNYSIADISDFTGFSSQSFFAQSFKRQTGLTPSRFRKSAARS